MGVGGERRGGEEDDIALGMRNGKHRVAGEDGGYGFQVKQVKTVGRAKCDTYWWCRVTTTHVGLKVCAGHMEIS